MDYAKCVSATNNMDVEVNPNTLIYLPHVMPSVLQPFSPTLTDNAAYTLPPNIDPSFSVFSLVLEHSAILY